MALSDVCAWGCVAVSLFAFWRANLRSANFPAILGLFYLDLQHTN